MSKIEGRFIIPNIVTGTNMFFGFISIVMAIKGDFEKAVKQLRKAAALKPEDVQAHYLLAIIYSSQSKEQEATDEYEVILQKVIEEDPGNSEGYAYLGQLYYSQGKLPQAIDQFEKVLALQPKNAEILSILGSLFLFLFIFFFSIF